MRKRKSTRTPTFGFYGGIIGAAFGFLVPSLLGIEEAAGLFQLLYGAAGFVVGMGAAVLIARLTEPNSGQRHP
ncbi:MAG: hypothetical protein M9921_13985 [Fimbriimonadaceae bacterium]|nr:hypothetical protein [Chthonomonadaceae bacterium]MCO5297954.1 hypothetical protein [Fimbriimonadaceae bacterium]